MTCKIAVVTAFMALCALGARAQKCEVGKDPFTGEEKRVYSARKGMLLLEKKKDGVKLTLTITYQGEWNTVIPRGSVIQLKMENGDMVELTSLNDASPKTHIVYPNVISNYAYDFVVDEPILKTLAASRTRLMRYPDEKGGHIDFVVKGISVGYMKSLQRGAQCMLLQ